MINRITETFVRKHIAEENKELLKESAPLNQEVEIDEEVVTEDAGIHSNEVENLVNDIRYTLEAYTEVGDIDANGYGMEYYNDKQRALMDRLRAVIDEAQEDMEVFAEQ